MEAVIFDFDGTIIDTESLWFEVYRDMLLSHFDYSLQIDDFSKVIGTNDDSLIKQLEREIGKKFNPVSFSAITVAEVEKKTKSLSLREGVLELIISLQSKGIKLAIASSSSRKWIQSHLEAFELTSYFPVIVSSDDVARVKPDPELYKKALERLGITAANRAVAVEDSGHGAIASIAAGIQTFVVPNPVTSFIQFPKEVIKFDSFQDLRKALEGALNDKTSV
ncbi:putative hydrolase of the HAD superfamily [Bacillus oleivorans]